MHYVGLDVHRKSIAFCIKLADGTIVGEGRVEARREKLDEWLATLPQPWSGAMEATIFSDWIYDYLAPHAAALAVGHPERMKAIAAGKKSDRLDARTIADLLRANLLPPAFTMPAPLRDLRRVLRYRARLVSDGADARNRIAGMLMQLGVPYDSSRLHGQKYFRELVKTHGQLIPDSARALLAFSRRQIETIAAMDRQLTSALAQHPDLAARVARLSSIRGVGQVTALTWALEIGPVERMGSIDRAVRYCGLCSEQKESADKRMRGPLSKRRNSHLQTVLIEAAHLAPHWNPELAAVQAREVARGHRNRATLAVARKLVAWLMGADRGHQPRAVPPEKAAV
jgi:transposase